MYPLRVVLARVCVRTCIYSIAANGLGERDFRCLNVSGGEGEGGGCIG